MKEQELLEVTDSTIQNFFNDFITHLAPLGRGGSDPEFMKVIRRLIGFVQSWDKWFQGYLSNVETGEK